MPDDGTVALIRDLFLIIACGVFVIVVVGAGVVAYQLYRRLIRVITTAEEISSAIKSGVEQVSNDAKEISSTVRASVEQVSGDVRYFSDTVLNRGARPLGSVVWVVELINRLVEMIQQFRSRQSRDEDATT